MEHTRTAMVPITLTGAAYRQAHAACHQAAGLWNLAVDFLHDEWHAGRFPSGYDLRAFLTHLPAAARPLHAHTTEAIAYDLADAVKTFRTNRAAGREARPPWRIKPYRPLSFTKDFGWRVTKAGRLHLSLGRGRPGLDLALPAVHDSATGEPVSPTAWGEIQLAWDRDARQWSLHIPYRTERSVATGDRVSAIDEGIINPMAVATWVDDHTIDVTIINAREARAVKRGRNKAVAALQRKVDRTPKHSPRRQRLRKALKRVKARATAILRDLDHKVSRQAATHLTDHHTGAVVVGDVRGIERGTKQERRASRHQRQRLSQWSRGRQEGYLREKTGLDLAYLNEALSTRTCPQCLQHNRPRGRNYRCRWCGFTCHRDAVGAINILQKALYGVYTRIGPDVTIRITYRRAVKRWSQRATRPARIGGNPPWSARRPASSA